MEERLVEDEGGVVKHNEEQQVAQDPQHCDATKQPAVEDAV